MTPEEIRDIKQEIAERYQMTFPDVCLEPLFRGRSATSRVRYPGRWAIVDQNTDTEYGICSDIYQPVPYEVTIKQAEDAIAKLPEFGTPLIKPILLTEGSKLRVNISFPEVRLEVKVGDIVKPFFDIMSSYDLYWKYVNRFGGERLVCSNGMTVNESFSAFKKRHLVSLDPAELIATIEAGMCTFSDQLKLWQNWTELKLMPQIYEAMWEELPFSSTERAKMEGLVEVGSNQKLLEGIKTNELTMWDMHSVVTQFATHEISSELRKIEILPQIEQVFDKFD